MIRFDPATPKGIVWLASYPKSGNTWLRMFLYQLHRIRLGQSREEDELNSIQRFAMAEIQFPRTYQLILGKPLAEASLAETIRVRAQVQAAIANEFPGIVMLKTHYALGMLNGAPTINQDVSSGAVYLVRDPRDVALSLANHVGKSVDDAIELMKTFNLQALGRQVFVDEIWGSWSQNVQSWTTGADETLLTVRYEDMLRDPIEAFTRIVHHLRKDATPAEIAEAVERSSFEELRGQEERFGFHERPETSQRFFVAGKAGRWREKLTPAQVDAIVSTHGPTMARFGYLDS